MLPCFKKMNSQHQPSLHSQVMAEKQSLGNSAEFDRWAKAVKEQMLSALRKRSQHPSEH
jgi:uncharacterized membrane protein